MLIKLVFPAPDGPNKAVARLSLVNATFIENSPRVFSTCTASMITPHADAPLRVWRATLKREAPRHR